MPKVKANNITINYEQQGSGEPLLLIQRLVYSLKVPAESQRLSAREAAKPLA
jgi:hypothetical protein